MQTVHPNNLDQLKEKLKKERAKDAVALAVRGEWQRAVEVNAAIVRDFPDDFEAHNRLGKALSEIGRNREAREAFQRALELSPYNTIAKKNLERLRRLGEDQAAHDGTAASPQHVLIEESGKAGVTSLVNLARPETLLRLAPGHPLAIEVERGTLRLRSASGDVVGHVEPRVASRLVRLINGGNRYEATVTSASETGVSVLIRESYKHPSQTGSVSFPSRNSNDYGILLQTALQGYKGDDDGADENRMAVKDWSDDDTEPGDDDAYSPMVHRIIHANNERLDEDADDEEI